MFFEQYLKYFLYLNQNNLLLNLKLFQIDFILIHIFVISFLLILVIMFVTRIMKLI